jgi:hypothetical protein
MVSLRPALRPAAGLRSWPEAANNRDIREYAAGCVTQAAASRMEALLSGSAVVCNRRRPVEGGARSATAVSQNAVFTRLLELGDVRVGDESPAATPSHVIATSFPGPTNEVRGMLRSAREDSGLAALRLYTKCADGYGDRQRHQRNHARAN